MRTTMRATSALIAVGAGLSACTTLFGDIDFKGKEASGGGGGASSSSSSSAGGGGSSSTTSSSSSGTAATCDNEKKDGDETGKDCGGSCDPCADGEGCQTGADCQSKSCGPGGACAAPACDDKVKNGGETDADCGGSCGPCGFGKGCAKNADCVTGFCNGATCDATTIVGGLTNPNSLAVDGSGVYWADGDDGTIMQADFATLTKAQLVGGLNGPQGVVIRSDTSQLFWVEPSTGNVGSRGAGDTSSPYGPLVTGQTGPRAVTTLTGTSQFFWTTHGSATAAGGIWTYEFTPTNVQYIAGHGDKIAILSNGAGGYTMTFSTDEDGGTLWRLTKAAGSSPGPATSLVAGVGIAGLAMDASNAYWTDGGAGTVAKVAITGGTPVVIASQQSKPADIRLDALYVYWINQGASAGTGALMKASLSGGAPTVVASGQDTPRGLFVTQSDVYWISGAKGQGTIKKMPK